MSRGLYCKLSTINLTERPWLLAQSPQLLKALVDLSDLVSSSPHWEVHLRRHAPRQVRVHPRVRTRRIRTPSTATPFDRPASEVELVANSQIIRHGLVQQRFCLHVVNSFISSTMAFGNTVDGSSLQLGSKLGICRSCWRSYVCGLALSQLMLQGSASRV